MECKWKDGVTVIYSSYSVLMWQCLRVIIYDLFQILMFIWKMMICLHMTLTLLQNISFSLCGILAWFKPKVMISLSTASEHIILFMKYSRLLDLNPSWGLLLDLNPLWGILTWFWTLFEVFLLDLNPRLRFPCELLQIISFSSRGILLDFNPRLWLLSQKVRFG